MKAVKVGKYQLDIIIENERYIDIYTYYDFSEDNILTLDNGKGWRLNELSRYDRKTGVEYNVSAEPNRSRILGGFVDFEINYQKNNVKYKRLIVINDFDGIQYVTQDIINYKESLLLTDEVRKKYNIRNDISLFYNGNKSILVKDGIVSIGDSIRNYNLNNKNYKLDDYIFNSKYDFDNTNSIIMDFYNFSKKIYVFGREGEEPRILKIIGENNENYDVIRRDNGIKKIVCTNPNKYVKQKVLRYYIDE